MRRRNGLALIFALLLVAAAAVLALAIAGRARDVAMDDARDRASLAAHAAARGGVERARWALARDASYAGESVRIGACDVDVRVTVSGGTTTVRAIARSPAAPFAETVTRPVVAELDTAHAGLPRVTSWRE